MISCNSCNYYEIWDKKNDSGIFFCKAMNCSKAFCWICFLEVKIPEENDQAIDSDDELDDKE